METYILWLYLAKEPAPIQLHTYNGLSYCALDANRVMHNNYTLNLRAVCVDTNGEVKYDSNLQ